MPDMITVYCVGHKCPTYNLPNIISGSLKVFQTACGVKTDSIVNLQAAQPFHPLGVSVVEKQAFAGVERGNLRHLLRVQLEIENLRVFNHARGGNGFGNHRHAALVEPAQNYLRPCSAAMADSTGCLKISFCPSANDAHD